MMGWLKSKLKCVALLVLTGFIITACASPSPPKSMVAEHLLETSLDAVERFRAHPDLKKFIHELENAAAVIILPSVIKAGLFAGGEIGNGLLLKRNGTVTGARRLTLHWRRQALGCNLVFKIQQLF